MPSTNTKTRREMKRIMCVAAVILLAAIRGYSQSPTTTYPYLYDNFISGTVVMDDGSKEARQMNVHLRAGRLHYIGNGIIKEAFRKDVAAVEIGSDVFIPVFTSVMKVVAMNDNGCVVLEQLGDFEAALSGSGAYGTSEVNQNYMNILNEKSEGADLQIISSYYIVTPKYKVRATRRDIEESIPEDKSVLLKDFIKANKIKWKSPEGLLPLVDFLCE